MMSSSGRSIRFPFTASQWQELEHQALVFKYMISGMPVPPDLLFTIKRSLDSSFSSKFLIHQPPQQIGWSSFHMGFGRKIDPEPGRCRRTDGKKWRCSKEAYPDSKYCERHMHRGRNRSRKPVEILSPSATATGLLHQQNATPINTTTTTTTTSITNNKNNTTPHFHFSSSRPPIFAQNTTSFFLEPNSTAHSPAAPPKEYCRNSSYMGHGMRGKVSGDEHGYAFLSDGNSSSNESSLKLAPLTMGSSLLKSAPYNSSDGHKIHQGLHDLSFSHQQNHHYHEQYCTERDVDHQPKKVMHRFLDEKSPKDKDSHEDNKIMSSHRTQLSISMPNSLHDFFITHKW